MRLDSQALRSSGIDFVFDREFDIWGDVSIDGPLFCAASLRFDTFLRIGAFCNLNNATEIGHTEIGRYTSIAQNCFIGADRHPTDWLSTSRIFYVPDFRGFSSFVGGRDPSHPFHNTGSPTRIGNDVLIANGCVISRGITIGNGAIVAPGSVVTKDVPAYAIVGGNPARVLRYRFSDEVIARLQALEWWRYSVFNMKAYTFTDIERFIDEFSQDLPNISPYDTPLRLDKHNYQKFLM